MEAYIEYCVDGYNVVRLKAGDLRAQLQGIMKETSGIFSAPFSADIVTGAGMMSLGLAENTVLCYRSPDLETQLTALGDPNAEGHTSFYFGDYSLMSNKYLIPYETALEAVTRFIKTGTLSENLTWTDELF